MAGSARVGVLALQGDAREHVAMLERLGATAVRVRTPGQLAQVEGLIIPGGESSVIDKLSRVFGIDEPLRAAIGAGLPVFGTCAGLIALADTVLDGIEGQRTFGGLDIVVRRNAFGAQRESFETELDMPAVDDHPIPAVFIRAPVIEELGSGVRVLARLDDDRVVAVEQGALLGTSFHPEMTGDTRLHARFLDRVRAAGRLAHAQ